MAVGPAQERSFSSLTASQNLLRVVCVILIIFKYDYSLSEESKPHL